MRDGIEHKNGMVEHEEDIVDGVIVGGGIRDALDKPDGVVREVPDTPAVKRGRPGRSTALNDSRDIGVRRSGRR